MGFTYHAPFCCLLRAIKGLKLMKGVLNIFGDDEYVKDTYMRIVRNFGFSLDIYVGDRQYCRKLLSDTMGRLYDVHTNLACKGLITSTYYRTCRRKILTIYETIKNDSQGIAKYK